MLKIKILQHTRIRTHDGETFHIFYYVHKRPFYNDCLNFAEYLTRECDKRLHYEEDGPCQLCVRSADILFLEKPFNLFGKTKKQNYEIARTVDDKDKNDNANPSVGENYAIIEGKNEDGLGYRYHIAHVVFKDVIIMKPYGKEVEKTVNITLEANRAFDERYEESGKEEDLLESPYFDCYSTVKEGPQKITTFHSTHCCGEEESYFEPITIVLKPKGDVLVTDKKEAELIEKDTKEAKKKEYLEKEIQRKNFIK